MPKWAPAVCSLPATESALFICLPKGAVLGDESPCLKATTMANVVACPPIAQPSALITGQLAFSGVTCIIIAAFAGNDRAGRSIANFGKLVSC